MITYKYIFLIYFRSNRLYRMEQRQRGRVKERKRGKSREKGERESEDKKRKYEGALPLHHYRETSTDNSTLHPHLSPKGGTSRPYEEENQWRKDYYSEEKGKGKYECWLLHEWKKKNNQQVAETCCASLMNYHNFFNIQLYKILHLLCFIIFLCSYFNCVKAIDF